MKARILNIRVCGVRHPFALNYTPHMTQEKWVNVTAVRLTCVASYETDGVKKQHKAAKFTQTTRHTKQNATYAGDQCGNGAAPAGVLAVKGGGVGPVLPPGALRGRRRGVRASPPHQRSLLSPILGFRQSNVFSKNSRKRSDCERP